MVPPLKRAIITGGTGGLGTAIADIFREAGRDVVKLGRKDLDLSDTLAVEAFFQAFPCDLLVCAAGATQDAPFARMAEGAWDAVLGLNYKAARQCAMAAIPAMAESGGGHVVFISSHAAIHPAVGQAAYSTAKAALLGLTEDLAGRWGTSGVRVNAVMPGFIETRMTASVSAARRGEVMAEHHLGRFNTPEAAAEFIRFLDERMPHTSGQVFQLDSRRGFF